MPWPLNNGGAIAQYFFLDALQNNFFISFCTIVTSLTEKKSIKVLQQCFPDIQFIYEDVSPKLTVLNRLRLFKKKLINFWRHADWNYQELNGDDFTGGYFTMPADPFPASFKTLIEREIKKSNIDIVQVDFYDMLPLLDVIPASVKKVAVIHELHTVRLKEMAPFSKVDQQQKNDIIEYNRIQEFDFLGKADECVVFHNSDQLFLKQFNIQATVSPFSIPDSLITKENPSDYFNHFLFTGSQAHTPNEVGLEWFLNEIFLPLHATLKKKIIITGKWQRSFKLKYEKKEVVEFIGEVEDLNIFFEKGILVVPIQVSTGLRTKILHAFANNVPVISTPVAATGCFDNFNNDHLLLFNTKEEFYCHFEEKETIDKKLKSTAVLGHQFWKKNYSTNKLKEIRITALLN